MTTSMLISRVFGNQNASVTFSEKANAFIGNGYTSTAGNHYYNAIRFADGIIIKEEVGQGYKYTFLNGIKIYSLRDKTLLTEVSYHNQIYSVHMVRSTVMDMLKTLLSEASSHHGFTLDTALADRIINKLIEDAFAYDQRLLANDQIKKLT